MPTTRPRHTITETADVSELLEIARLRWPEDADRPTRLLGHLLDVARATLTDDESRMAAHRRTAVVSSSGALTGVYPSNYLASLRDEWPE